MNKIDFWTLVDYLPTRMPLDKEKLERALGVVMVRTEKSNEYFEFLKGGPVYLNDEVQIANIDLRLSRESTTKTLLILTLAGKCIERGAVLVRERGLAISQSPRGRSLDEQTAWSRSAAWGKLSFGFAERNRDCLRSVVFETA